jgi:hypothetical protein
LAVAPPRKEKSLKDSDRERIIREAGAGYQLDPFG